MLESAQVGNTSISLDINQFYSSDGPLSQQLSEFRERPQQKEMAKAITKVLESGENLLVEAGTGTGKSLAYLAPLARFSMMTERPVVVSTNTINLQQQLQQADAPVIQKIMGDGFRFTLMKGRSNYLCPRRLRKAYQRRHLLFSNPQAQNDLERLVQWHEQTTDGTLSDIDWNLSMDVWSKVNAKKGICRCLRDNPKEPCYYAESRKRMQNTNLIIANHHLFMQDLALRIDTDFGILPKYAAAVVDEAHNLENVARSCLGIQVTYLQFNYLIRDLYHPDKQSGFLRMVDAESLGEQVKQLDRNVETFFDEIRDWYDANSKDQRPQRVYQPNIVPNHLDGPIQRLLDQLRKKKQTLDLNEDDDREFQSLIDRLSSLKMDLENFLQQTRPDDVYWVERSDYRDNVTLRSSLVDVSEVLHEHFFQKVHSATLTSATLATGSSDPFSYLEERLGAQGSRHKRLGHPFDYENQVTVRLTPRMPPPNGDPKEYVEGLSDWLERYLCERKGDAFVLFTSYRVLNQVADKIRPSLEKSGIRVLIQGRDQSRNKLLDLFEREEPAVLFGAQSFWEGVDVPGSSLRHVIITKLPFPNPSDPLTEATGEHIEKEGGNPFFDFFLPEAILRLKQGFGRLIRHQDDQGEVAILDNRIVQKSYGSQFLKALPPCRIIHETPS